MDEFIKALPKAELHAHLSGSVRNSTLLELIRSNGVYEDEAELERAEAMIHKEGTRSLSDCFRIFDVVHKILNNKDSVSRAVYEMIEDCVLDLVSYLEIRTTPRRLTSFAHAEGELILSSSSIVPPHGTTFIPPSISSSEGEGVDGGEEVDAALSNYIEVVVAAIVSAQASFPSIVVRLIISINRTSSVETNRRIVKLAKVWSRVHCPLSFPVVVGLDISGDPTRGNMPPLLKMLDEELLPSTLTTTTAAAAAAVAAEEQVQGNLQQQPRRQRVLKVAVHAGEVMNVLETESILDWCPDRLGHMCVLSHTSQRRVLSQEATRPIPLELCPTSNSLTLHLPTLEHHPLLVTWLESKYPMAICTDDSGVFNITLSQELIKVASAFQLDKQRVSEIALGAFSYSFANEQLASMCFEKAKAEVAGLLSGV